MKIVIQCAGSKNNDGFWRTNSGERVLFVARPEKAPSFSGRYAHPDGVSEANMSWREQLIAYNDHSSGNPFNLYPAYRLYKNSAYPALVARFGAGNIYILSAGWGLVRSDFLLPQYDITFQAQAESYQRRGKNDRYDDFCMIPPDTRDGVVYLGGKDYRPLFYALTRNLPGRKVILHNQEAAPLYEGCESRRFQTEARTNWHYACAHALMAGSFVVDE